VCTFKVFNQSLSLTSEKPDHAVDSQNWNDFLDDGVDDGNKMKSF